VTSLRYGPRLAVAQAIGLGLKIGLSLLPLTHFYKVEFYKYFTSTAIIVYMTYLQKSLLKFDFF